MGLFSRFESKVENTVEGAAERFSSAPVSPAAIAKKCEKRMKSERMVGSGRQYAPTLYTVLVNPSDDRAMMGYYPTLSGELETLLTARAEESGLTMDGTPLVRFIADNSLRSGKFDVIAETVAAPIVEQLRDDELQRYGITRGRYEAELARKKARAREQAQQARREELQARNARRQDRDAAAEYGERPDRRERAGRVRPNSPRDMAPYAEDDPNAYAPETDAYGNAPIRPMVYDSGYDRDSHFGSEPGENGKRRLPYVPEEAIDRSVDYGEYTFNSLNFEELDRRQRQEEPAARPESATAAPEPARTNAPSYPERPSRPFADSDVPEVLAPIEPASIAATAAAPAPTPVYVAPASAAKAAPAAAAKTAPAAKPVAEPAPASAAAAAKQVAAANAEAVAAASAYRTPITFTPASKIAPEARAMPARPVPGVLEREEQPGTPTVTVAPASPAEAAPKTMPYTDTPKPAPRYRIRNLQDGRSYTLTGTRVYIGRENTCNIVVSDVNASRRHAELRNTGKGVWTLTDLGSTNGTFVNGKTASQAVLVNGDRITVGTTDLIFVVS